MELVINNNGKNVTTSIIIAKVFNKRHDNVLRDISALECSESFAKSNFIPIQYQSRGRNYQAYAITKDGFSFLVMGYNGSKAAKFKEDFIREFNNREQLLLNEDYILQRAMSILTERTKALEGQLLALAPKVEYYDKVMESSSTYTSTQVANELGMSAFKMHLLLHDLRVIYKVSGQWVLYSEYRGNDYMRSKTITYGQGYSKIVPRWTEKGRAFIHSKLK